MKKYGLMLVAVLGLVGCGFRPLYLTENNKQNIIEQTAAVAVEPISGEGGYQMELILAEKLNPKQLNRPKKYRLEVRLGAPSYSDKSLKDDNFATIEEMNVVAFYTLIQSDSGEKLVSASLNSSGLFNLIREPYATVVSKDQLYQNLIKVMSDEIALHIMSYFKGLES